MYWVIRRLTTDKDTGVLIHLAECVQLCLDIETMEGSARDQFLGVSSHGWEGVLGVRGRGGVLGVRVGRWGGGQG